MPAHRAPLEHAHAREQGLLDIGQAAAASGVSAKMIRHYEEIGLLREVPRTAANYRVYNAQHVHALRFIRRARKLGFPVAEIQALLDLWQNQRRSSATVKRIATRHIDALQARVDELQSMLATLRHLVHCCAGDERPDCPILDDLEHHPAEH
ncbi:Cu(I)-responsive transcriptional regulator [Uliginosibacterium sp. H1]|uniref:Cu(I)-responsive transcriptional regulator n=1 Tax=Uliginosibacterium sp. H1 TaxID=3114757 RepID=UPI002E17508E|nr:Cu(I)-responsive transcriptional regulator [Uliginosibacterium sp. H1]